MIEVGIEMGSLRYGSFQNLDGHVHNVISIDSIDIILYDMIMI